VDWSPRATRRPSKLQASSFKLGSPPPLPGSWEVETLPRAPLPGARGSLRFVVELNVQVRTPKSIRFNDLSRSHGLTPHLSTLTAWHQRQPSSSKQVLLVSPCGFRFRFRFLLRIPINWQPPPIPLLSPSCSSSTSFCNPRFQTVSRDRLPGLISNLPLSHKSSTNITAMSRVTPPVTKFAHALRRISSSANAGRPSSLLDSQARASRYLPRNLKDLRAECKQRKLNSSGNKAEVRWDPLQRFHHSIDMI
jgi:hypothetical protein